MKKESNSLATVTKKIEKRKLGKKNRREQIWQSE